MNVLVISFQIDEGYFVETLPTFIRFGNPFFPVFTYNFDWFPKGGSRDIGQFFLKVGVGVLCGWRWWACRPLQRA